MFARVVARLEAGEAYYPAMGHELRSNNYPAASVFNWRTPTLYHALAAAPRSMVASLAISLYVILLGSHMVYFAQKLPPHGTIIGLVLSAVAGAIVFDSRGRLLSEAWCGMLIGLSLAAYMRRAWTAGAVIGVAAIFVRELAALHCIVCILLAGRARRKRELGVWAVGLIVFAGFYALHVFWVLHQVRPDDLAHAGSWIQFGGLAFWLSTIKANVALSWAPHVFLAAFGVLLVAGLGASSLPPHVCGAAVAYSLFFGVAGRPFNDYWGLVTAFPFATALAHGPSALVALVRQAAPPRSEMSKSAPRSGRPCTR
jgi:hypothetical protein